LRRGRVWLVASSDPSLNSSTEQQLLLMGEKGDATGLIQKPVDSLAFVGAESVAIAS
jgi:hypothetical protein